MNTDEHRLIAATLPQKGAKRHKEPDQDLISELSFLTADERAQLLQKRTKITITKEDKQNHVGQNHGNMGSKEFARLEETLMDKSTGEHKKL